MNWRKIKEKYPKAFRKYAIWKWQDENPKILENGNIFFEQVFVESRMIATAEMKLQDEIAIRLWYDFFDEQGIYIEITLAHTKDWDIWFEYLICSKKLKDDFCSMDEPDYCEPYKTKTRIEAEEQAFLKAFEILEKK